MEEMTDEKALSILDREYDYRPQEGLMDGQGRARYYPGYWVQCLNEHRRERRFKERINFIKKLFSLGFWRQS